MLTHNSLILIILIMLVFLHKLLQDMVFPLIISKVLAKEMDTMELLVEAMPMVLIIMSLVEAKSVGITYNLCVKCMVE